MPPRKAGKHSHELCKKWRPSGPEHLEQQLSTTLPTHLLARGPTDGEVEAAVAGAQRVEGVGAARLHRSQQGWMMQGILRQLKQGG